MGIIEEIEYLVEMHGYHVKRFEDPAVLHRMLAGWSFDAAKLLPQVTARLRELERTEGRCPAPCPDGKPCGDAIPIDGPLPCRHDRPGPTTKELLRRIEALEMAVQPSVNDVDQMLFRLRRRVEALEAREEARGRLEAEAVPPGSPPAPTRPCGAFCDPDAGYHTEGCRYRHEPPPTPPEPKASGDHCPHTPCCYCAGDWSCPGEGTKVMLIIPESLGGP
jgi:hypothetical protein